MPGDELHEETAAAVAKAVADAGRARTGPRHAAPKKPLLTRLHMPAGKAIAMAAMPSAVLMGMGLTPQLASAKSLPKNPLKDGQCVSAPDKDEDAEEQARQEAAAAAEKNARKQAEEAAEKAQREAEEKAEQEAEEKKRKAEQEAEKAEEKAEAQEKAEQEAEKAEQEAEDAASGDSGGSDPAPSPSESESGSGGLLGGIGDAVRDVLTPEEKAQQEAEQEKAEQEKAEDEPSPSGTGSSETSDSSGALDDAAGKVQDGLKDTTDKLKDGAEDATGKVPTPSATEESQDSATAEEDPAAAAKEGSYPCVEEKKVAGEDEQTPAVLPNQAWQLEASKLGLHGLDYKGVRNVKTADGGTKQVLKFTADSVDIRDLHQIVDGPDGLRYHVQAAEGSTSTIRGGQVTMYTEKLQGNLFGLVPITFDPEHPPPLNLPEVTFTNVKVQQAGQFGGNLTVPGLHSFIEQ